ncbi:MAG: glucosaminidase domain-containing protein [Succinivibrio sp.]|nr:glucosaminidase domain-containing protein [Succinivibrio sp.]
MEEQSVQDLTAQIGLLGDPRGLDKLRAVGKDKHSQAQALRAAAEQFENMFMEQWYNAMRQSNESLCPDSPLHSKYSGMFEDMLSQQHVAAGNHKGKLSKSSITYLLASQFSKSLGDAGKELLEELTSGKGSSGVRYVVAVNPKPYMFKGQPGYKQTIEEQQAKEPSVSAVQQIFASLPDPQSMRSFESKEDFVKKMMPYALKAVEGLGFNPLVLVAQAALETGWGQHVPKGNNYYGIKADRRWQGEAESLSSPEFVDGKMVKEVSKFRKYSDVLASMKDYISFIKGNQRYANAVDKSFDPDHYFDEIQKAGYATDPQYAAKLKNISRQIAFMAQN